MIEYAKERDEAFIDFVETGKLDKVREFCGKYGLAVPEDENIMKAGIYKAVRYCTNIPEDVKEKAFIKCIELGFSPVIEEAERKES